MAERRSFGRIATLALVAFVGAILVRLLVFGDAAIDAVGAAAPIGLGFFLGPLAWQRVRQA